MERKRSKEYSVVFLGEAKVQVAKFAFKDFVFIVFTAESLSSSKHNRVSEVFKGVLKVRQIEH